MHTKAVTTARKVKIELLMQATVLKLIKQPAMMKSLLGVVLFEMVEFPIVLAMLIVSVEIEVYFFLRLLLM